jgi:transcriptional regulator with XRE-family HTH domain
MPARTDLGNRIRAARADLGWKQKNLAAEVRVEPITVSRRERGATTPISTQPSEWRSLAAQAGSPEISWTGHHETDAFALQLQGDDALERARLISGHVLCYRRRGRSVSRAARLRRQERLRATSPIRSKRAPAARQWSTKPSSIATRCPRPIT